MNADERRHGEVRRRIGLRLSAFICGLMTFAGCQEPKSVKEGSRAVQDYLAGDFPRATQRLTPLSTETNENYVLNNLRLGSTALAAYDLGTAESASVCVDDKLKIWKPDPYERAMASFDLGLVYLLRNDFNNARAAFENALFKLRDYATDEDEKAGYTQQESTFVLAHVLLGRCWHRLGREDVARRAFDDVSRLRPDLAPLAD